MAQIFPQIFPNIPSLQIFPDRHTRRAKRHGRNPSLVESECSADTASSGDVAVGQQLRSGSAHGGRKGNDHSATDGSKKGDGGWALATLGDWKRGDELQQDTEHSDGYGTGFVLYALRGADVSPSDAVMRNGVKWLKSNQRESGRWYTRSLFKDNHHFISHAGTAMAVLALKSCEETNVSTARQP